MPKLIMINGRFLTQSITGVQRFAVECVKALDTLIDNSVITSEHYQFVLLIPSDTKYELKLDNISVKKVGHLRGQLWEQLELPFYSQGQLLLNLCNTAPLLKLNQVVTIHDASVFSVSYAYSFLFRSWYKFLLKRLGKRSRKIVTVSRFSKNELIEHLSIKSEKINVICEGKEHIFELEKEDKILNRHNLSDKGFILAVSSMNPNKNFNSIIHAIELLGDIEFDIVIAGGTNSKIFSNLDVPLTAKIKHLGYVTDAELRTLYEHAAAFIYPSFYEGFGLPPLEAMAVGCPVIVSNAASLPEVCGDAALYCDPYDTQDIADKVRQLIHDSDLRQLLKLKGLERAKQFTWKNSAKEMLSVIEEVVSHESRNCS